LIRIIGLGFEAGEIAAQFSFTKGRLRRLLLV
jgi:hypothetical protein